MRAVAAERLAMFLPPLLPVIQSIFMAPVPSIPSELFLAQLFCWREGASALPPQNEMCNANLPHLLNPPPAPRHPSCSCIWTRVDMISISPLSSPPIARPSHLS